MDQPFVSIGMPVYNSERLIRRALDSLLAQDHANFELIISDDASTDTTVEICREYAKQDKRISLLENFRNMGPLANFLRVLEPARGEFFMWAAHDDYRDRNYISALLEQIEGSDHFGLCCAKFVKVTPDNRIISTHPFPKTVPQQDVVSKTRAIMAGLGAPWIYGLYRTADLRSVYSRIAPTGLVWGFDHLIILSYLFDQRLTGTNATTIYQIKTGLSAQLWQPRSLSGYVVWGLTVIHRVLQVLSRSRIPLRQKIGLLLTLPVYLERKIFHIGWSHPARSLKRIAQTWYRALRRGASLPSAYTIGMLKNPIKKLPPIRRLIVERDHLKHKLEISERALEMSGQELARHRTRFPPGHYYSPIPSQAEIRADENRIFSIPAGIHGIDLNEKEQLRLLAIFKHYYKELPYKPEKQRYLRYYLENSWYPYSDGICLYCMIRCANPSRIIEVGSGFSSAVMLDTNERFFNHGITLTFIDPDPQRLESLLMEEDVQRVEIIPKRVQDVELDKFRSLQQGDILFIDSTHVSKAGSDVHYIFFEVLPIIQAGVYIHFHDVYYPFEYMKELIYEGFAWNEAYLLRAFLQYNPAFKIVFFNTYLEHRFPEIFNEEMPLCMKNPGASIWLQKVIPGDTAV